MKYNLGNIIAGVGIAVRVIVYFGGPSFDATQIGQAITDGFQFFSDIAVVYGVFHSWIQTRSLVKGLQNAGLVA